jgi:two-component system, NtrC family, nitrogen regulation response regulator NtrX
VRELKNNIERIMILASGEQQDEISVAMLPNDNAAKGQGSVLGGEHLLAMTLRDAREAFERDYMTAQLARFAGNISRTAIFIGMERSALHRKIKLLGLTGRDSEDFG